MRRNLILTGDINRLGVTDPTGSFGACGTGCRLPTWCLPTWSAVFTSQRVNTR